MKDRTEWTEIQKRLLAMQDTGYRAFQSSLMPSVDPARVIGVRTPQLRSYAKQIAGTPMANDFLECLPHSYYEEDQLHAFLIEQIRDFDEAVAALDRFLPFVDNWATCDGMSPKVLGMHTDRLLPHAYRWMESEHCYTCRYGIGMLMRYFLADGFSEEYPRRVAEIKRDEYYVNIMIAWYFATAVAFQYEEILPYITHRRLSPWIHQKTIQKAVESRRLTDSQKQFLKSLR